MELVQAKHTNRFILKWKFDNVSELWMKKKFNLTFVPGTESRFFYSSDFEEIRKNKIYQSKTMTPYYDDKSRSVFTVKFCVSG